VKLLTALAVAALCLPLWAQAPFNVTISEQPTSVEVASLGASVYKVAIYSGEVCSSPGVTLSGSWGEVSQLAEAGGVNIVNPALVPAVTQAATSKTKTHKLIQYVGWIALSAVFIAATHSPPPWLVQAGTTVTAVADIVGTQLSVAEAQAAANTNAALSVLADPTSQFSVSNGACIAARILFGQQLNNFVPIKASLPTIAQSPALREERRDGPGSQIPGATTSTPTHPAMSALQPSMEVAGWRLPETIHVAADEPGTGWTTLVSDEAVSGHDTREVALAVR
jgi:hypothetical protein